MARGKHARRAVLREANALAAHRAAHEERLVMEAQRLREEDDERKRAEAIANETLALELEVAAAAQAKVVQLTDEITALEDALQQLPPPSTKKEKDARARRINRVAALESKARGHSIHLGDFMLELLNEAEDLDNKVILSGKVRAKGLPSEVIALLEHTKRAR